MLVAALLMIGVVAVGVAFTPDASAPAKESAAQRACAKVKALNAERNDSVSPVTQGAQPAVVVLGDSYAQGYPLAEPRTQSWPTLFGQERKLTVWVNAAGGTGFVNAGPCGSQEFVSRVVEVLAHRPRAVIVQGGLNDVSFDPRRTRQAAGTLLAALADVPRVVIVGPTRPPKAPVDAVHSTDVALRAAARTAGRVYISTVSWSLPYGPDGLHPTADGQRRYAALLSRQLDRGRP